MSLCSHSIYESNSQTLQTVGGLMFKWGRAGEVGPPPPPRSKPSPASCISSWEIVTDCNNAEEEGH